MHDVTDATFENDVIERSRQVPVVDLWAPWCGPCRTLGPMIEQIVEETGGAVELAKVNVDENPRVSATFSVQSIPRSSRCVTRRSSTRSSAQLPEAQVRAFVERLAPVASEADLLAEAGDEESLRRALELEPGHVGATEALARVLLERGDADGALEVLAKIPETPSARSLAAEARLAQRQVDRRPLTWTALLDSLLERAKGDDAARQEFLDLLETLAPEDERSLRYRAPWPLGCSDAGPGRPRSAHPDGRRTVAPEPDAR